MRMQPGFVLAGLVPIPEHALALLLLQLGLLLFVARIGALAARGIGLPAVVGELAAGIVLGPSVFGHYAPSAFLAVFPQESGQYQLLETVGLLGMVLLLLLTGLETDLRLLKSLGRAAVVASALGMLVPFALGFGLGVWMPEQYLAQPERRTLFAAFLATTMAISAMPVIAKILMDLDLTRRNIGLVILSAGVVDDTAGWLILSIIAGAATQGGGVKLTGLALTVISLFGFLALVALVVYPVMRFVLRALATRVRSPDTDLVSIVAVTLACAALTQHIGVHAVFGAFIVGTALRQAPHLSHETVHRLESFVFSILAPVFFGFVGLKVDLWSLSGGGGVMLVLVVAIACVGKLLGCSLGGIWGGLSFWEAFSIAVAMNARGAMGLVAATIGLSLGILNQQTFSMIVVMAILTSFIAPIALRLTMRMVRMTHEEERRILVEQSKGQFDTSQLRVLVPTAGGPHALQAARLAVALTKRSENPVEVVFVEQARSTFERLLKLFSQAPAGRGIDEHLATIKSISNGKRAARIRRLSSKSAAKTIVDEASHGVDLIMIGGTGQGGRVGGRILEQVVEDAPCHVAIVKAGNAAGTELRRVFVPVDGSAVSRLAAELGLRFAESTGATLTLAFVSERRMREQHVGPVEPDTLPGAAPEAHDAGTLILGVPPTPDLSGPPLPIGRAPSIVDGDRASVIGDAPLPELLARVSPAFRVTTIQPEVLQLDYDPTNAAVAKAIVTGGHDLVVLGAENRAVRRRLFFGYESQRIIALESATMVILVPKAKTR
jgi:Kef-type K+ transport system membrane component KefB/nucleotide-binding universal stress UspA family protein